MGRSDESRSAGQDRQSKRRKGAHDRGASRPARRQGGRKNYIVRLRHEKAEVDARMERVLSAVLEFRAHLDSDKFYGFEQDGSRKDWIATRDVHRWLGIIANQGEAL
jgi:hypothetical protein